MVANIMLGRKLGYNCILVGYQGLGFKIDKTFDDGTMLSCHRTSNPHRHILVVSDVVNPNHPVLADFDRVLAIDSFDEVDPHPTICSSKFLDCSHKPRDVEFQMHYQHFRARNFAKKRCARIIQRMWRECICNPNYMMCKRRLILWEFPDLQRSQSA